VEHEYPKERRSPAQLADEEHWTVVEVRLNEDREKLTIVNSFSGQEVAESYVRRIRKYSPDIVSVKALPPKG
jgi:hypothetical protein